jgi:hypothetical protein
MKRYLLPCVCSARIAVSAGQAGDRIRCPACGAEQPVPRLGELARLEQATDAGSERHTPGHFRPQGEHPVPGRPLANRPWTAGHWAAGSWTTGSMATGSWTAAHACLLAGLFAMLLGGGAAVVVQATRSAVVDADMIRMAVQGGSIVDIHQAWQAFARQGVERPIMPDEAQLLRQAGIATAVGRLLWGVAALGLVLAIAGGIAVARAIQRPVTS